jgi:cytochrome c oxidase cbb3-type subunit 1
MGGVLFLVGMLIMAYNMFKTMAAGNTDDAPVLIPAGQHV